MNKISTLKNKREISEIFKYNNCLSNSTFIIRYKPNNLSMLRYAISVKKIFFKTAVLRNKIKRQIREIIKVSEEIKSIDALIIVKETYNTLRWSDNKKSLLSLFKKSK